MDDTRTPAFESIQERFASKLSPKDLTDLLSMILDYGDEQEQLGWNRCYDETRNDPF